MFKDVSKLSQDAVDIRISVWKILAFGLAWLGGKIECGPLICSMADVVN